MLDRNRRIKTTTYSVRPGMLVEFDYTKQNGDSDTYIVLVIDPNLQSDRAKENQLHGFKLNDMSENELSGFLSELAGEELNTDEAYDKFLSSSYLKNRIYRTFSLSRIGSISKIVL